MGMKAKSPRSLREGMLGESRVVLRDQDLSGLSEFTTYFGYG